MFNILQKYTISNKLLHFTFGLVFVPAQTLSLNVKFFCFMLRFICIFSLGLCAFTAKAQNTIKPNSEVQSVTLFFQGAQVERYAEFEVPAGNLEIVFEGLEASIDPSTIRWSGSGAFSFIDGQYISRKIPANQVPKSPYYQDLQKAEDSLRLMGYEMELALEQVKSIEAERTLLYENPMATGKSIGDSLDLLIDALDFHREQRMITMKHLLEAKEELHELQLDFDPLKTRVEVLRELDQSWAKKHGVTRHSGTFMASISSTKKQTIAISFNYLVQAAGWSPSYRFELKDQELNFERKAEAWQRTGVSWENVNLAFATHNNRQNLHLPQLPDTQVGKPIRLAYQSQSNPKPMAKSEAYDEEMEYEEYQVQENLGFQIFTLNSKHQLKPGKAQQMVLEQKKLAFDLHFQAFPSQNPMAYRVATIKEWKGLNLLAAEAEIFSQGQYIGKLYLNQNMDGVLSFGTDARIMVKREVMQEKDKKQHIGNQMLVEKGFLYSVENNSNQSIALQIKDRFPYSPNEEVKIEVKSNENSMNYNALDGMVEWNMEISSQQKAAFEGSYEIKMPKNFAPNAY